MRVTASYFKRRSVRIALGSAVGVFAIMASILSIHAATTPALAQQEGLRLITLYDRGETTSFMTTESTIEKALKAANIQVDERDAVEPARSEKLVAPDYQVNIYRARPVTVIDGALKQKVFSPYQSAERIVKDVNISLYPEDRTELTRSDDVLGQESGLRLKIIRAVPFELTLFGETSTARTQAGTVGAMLKEKGITLGENDRVSIPVEAPISEGLQVRVWREGKQTITVDEEVAFEVEKIQDADRAAGYREVKTPGKKGERSVTYEVIIRDGKEVNRTEITSIVKKKPQSQVEVIGVKVPPITGTCGDWMAAAGLPSTNSVNYLITKESRCNPRAVNKSSGACGIGQALPCRKMGPVNPDGTSAVSPTDQLKWMNSYVIGRYGSWEKAEDFHRKNNWY